MIQNSFISNLSLLSTAPPSLWPPGSALQRFKKFLKRDRNTRLGSSPKTTFKEDEAWKIPPRTWYRCNNTSHRAKRLCFSCLFPGLWPAMERQEMRSSSAPLFFPKIGEFPNSFPEGKSFTSPGPGSLRLTLPWDLSFEQRHHKDHEGAQVNVQVAGKVSVVFNCYRGHLSIFTPS